jgi:fructose-1,6-bisphosphatase-3
MRFVLEQGSMMLKRDEHLVFHGCVPVDETGELLSFEVDGVARRGRELFEAIETVVRRAFRERREKDLDLLYYLWAGARSPLFGKDRMATFETYFVADKNTHKETKNAYFKLIHDVAFCRKISAELGGDPETSLIVNGHVPVKLEEGESPLKKSGRAVTIDGAFSEAYGDKGYTLVLDSDRTFLAQHHHFESVEDAIVKGADIIPTIQDIRVYPQIRRVGETVRGDELRAEIGGLERLVRAYREHEVVPPST